MAVTHIFIISEEWW